MNGGRHIVCGMCGKVNRVADDRSAAGARCGACREPLFSGLPLEADETGFERHVSRNDIPVLVDVWAPWCGPCRAMAPMFAEAARILEPDVRLLKLNSDRAPSVSARLGIRSIPTLLLMKDGKVVARSSGVMDVHRIVSWTRSSLAGAHAA
ncbi:thioredoxin TrxC [Taklimakanibacter lacteus]|uniref:thioredoxin TrxC n=1 Tax=Taklimakanibacter lacteus TaxID=2268456 RepID=UPI000E670BD9